jgi:hypothetical protein
MMPLQEVFLERHIGTDRILAIKTYDRHFATEAFCQMDDAAMSTLAESLNLEETYFEDDIPSINTPEFPEFVWEALLEEAREDGSLLSFFVVYREAAGSRKNLIVTPDWPTAESFASRL